MTNRRSFLASCAALLTAPLVAMRVKKSLPVLYGDGVHDDAPALQALIDGRPVWDAYRADVLHFADGNVDLPPTDRVYRVLMPLTIPRGKQVTFPATYAGLYYHRP